jgi:maltooligosyltrehalose trehalohydrolase
MRHLVRACHEQSIAVIIDAVYAHAHPEFPYNLVYEDSGEPNPMMGRFEGEFFAHPGNVQPPGTSVI